MPPMMAVRTRPPLSPKAHAMALHFLVNAGYAPRPILHRRFRCRTGPPPVSDTCNAAFVDRVDARLDPAAGF